MNDEIWFERLQAAVAETLRKRAARRDIRRELDAARQVGLARRHAQKLARIHEEDTVPDVPPCCAAVAEPPCPQHQQARRETRHAGPRSRSGRPSAVVGESGRAKPATETREQS